MDYTQSNGYQTDPITGNRLHVASQAIPTMVSDTDLNALTWEVMAAIRGAGIAPIPFDKSVPASYSQLLAAINARAMSKVMNVTTRITTDQALTAYTETVLNASPSSMDNDLYSFSNGYYVVKKRGWYQVASRLSVQFNPTVSATHDSYSSIKCYKAGITITNANFFDGSTQYQPMPVYTGTMPTTFYRLMENRKLVFLDVGDKVAFILYFVASGNVLCADIPTRNSVFEFLYFGEPS